MSFSDALANNFVSRLIERKIHPGIWAFTSILAEEDRMQSLKMLDHSVQITHEWINELDAELGWKSRARSFRLLRAVLHALRDCLPPAEAADLAAQLPTLLRGVFYEHYRPMHLHAGRWSLEEFLERLNRSFPKDPIEEGMADAANAVFAQLARRVSAGEIRDIIQTLPTEIRELWLA